MASRTKAKGKGSGLSGQELKAFRSQVAALKRKGIVSKKVDARSQAPTKYMRAKVRKFQDVLEGKAIAVKAPKAVREQYRESEALPVRGSHIIAEKEFANQRARLRKGLVTVARPLKGGQEEYVILPFKLTDMPALIERLKDDPTLNDLKRPDELFSFRLYGHNSGIGFPDWDEFINYVERNYSHLFKSGKDGRRAIKHLTFQRYREFADVTEYDDEEHTWSGNPNRSKEPKIFDKGYGDRRKVTKPEVLAKRAETQRLARLRDTPAQKDERNRKNRERMARLRAKRFLHD